MDLPLANGRYVQTSVGAAAFLSSPEMANSPFRPKCSFIPAASPLLPLLGKQLQFQGRRGELEPWLHQ